MSPGADETQRVKVLLDKIDGLEQRVRHLEQQRMRRVLRIALVWATVAVVSIGAACLYWLAQRVPVPAKTPQKLLDLGASMEELLDELKAWEHAEHELEQTALFFREQAAITRY